MHRHTGRAGGGRYGYSEFEVGDRTVAMIEDRENVRAWIQSDVTTPVRE